jgi:hypothetical protein
MDHIRIMLIWSELQPNATYVRGELLDRLEEMLELAAQRNLDVEVTVLNGAVSGVLFVPPYLISNSNGQIRNVLTDPFAIEREQWVLTQIAERAMAHGTSSASTCRTRFTPRYARHSAAGRRLA